MGRADGVRVAEDARVVTRRARRVFVALWIGGALLGVLGQAIYLSTGWRWAGGLSVLGLAVTMVQIIRMFLFQAKGVNVFRADPSIHRREGSVRDDDTNGTGESP